MINLATLINAGFLPLHNLNSIRYRREDKRIMLQHSKNDDGAYEICYYGLLVHALPILKTYGIDQNELKNSKEQK